MKTCQRSAGMELISYNHTSSPELDTYTLLVGNREQLVLLEPDSLDLFQTPTLRWGESHLRDGCFPAVCTKGSPWVTMSPENVSSVEVYS